MSRCEREGHGGQWHPSAKRHQELAHTRCWFNSSCRYESFVAAASLARGGAPGETVAVELRVNDLTRVDSAYVPARRFWRLIVECERYPAGPDMASGRAGGALVSEAKPLPFKEPGPQRILMGRI